MEYLLIMSVSGSVMVGIYMLLRYASKNKISARLQYMLAKAAVLYYLIPLPFVRKWYGEIAMRVHPVNMAGVLRVSPKWDYFAIRANGRVYYNSYAKIQLAVLSVWLLIALTILALELFDYIKTGRTLTHCMSETRIEESDSVKRLKEQCGLRRKINVYQGENGTKTITFGFVKPVILCGHEVGSKESEFILRHELIHIKRCDTVWKMLRRFVVFLHWFNPVAWFLYFDFERVCEWSCDEETVSGRTKEERKEYVRLLIAESTKISDGAKSYIRWSAGFGNGAERLRRRIENIMMMKKWNKMAAGIITVGLVFINSLTVFAYPDVTYMRSEINLTQGEIDRSLEADEWVYIPDALDEKEVGKYALYRGDYINIRYDKQFTDIEGNIYSLEDENSADVYERCTHTYVSGTVSLHAKKTTGSCTTIIYSAQRCTKCGEVLMGDYKMDMNFAPCPH